MARSSGVMRFKVSPIDIIAFIYCTTLFEIWGSLRVPVELLCMVCFVIHHFRNGKGIRLVGANRYYIWALAFAFMCFVSILYAVNSREAFLGTRMYLETFLAGFCVLFYLNSQDRMLKFLKFTVICAIVFFAKLLATNPLQTLLTSRQIGSINANTVGMKMAICCMIAMWLLKEKHINFFRFCVVIVLLIPAIMVTGSKKAIFILVFGIGLLLLLYQKNILRILGYVLIALLALYGVYFLIMNNQALYNMMGKRVEGLLNVFLYGYERGDYSTKGRIDMIQLALREWRERPFFGYGINNFGIYNGLSAFGSVNMYSHCNYTELLFGVGAVGTAFYYSIFPWLLARQVKSFRTDGFQRLYLALTIIIIILDIGMVSYIDEFIQAQILLACTSCTLFIGGQRNANYSE